jgi:hypothetical protein
LTLTQQKNKLTPNVVRRGKDMCLLFYFSQKIPINQLKSQTGAAQSTQGGTLISQTTAMSTQPLNTLASSGGTGTTASPGIGSLPQPATPELLSLKDIFVPLQTVKPCKCGVSCLFSSQLLQSFPGQFWF